MIITRGDLISVIIPCYNQARYLNEAIESVLAQTYRGYEIIVVDDGSTDMTASVAASYPEVRYIRQANQGLAAARNAGIRAGKGDYFVFLDADDRLLPWALETGLKALIEHPACAFVYGQCRFIAADGTFTYEPRQSHVERDHYLELLQENFIYTPANVMYRRGIIEAVGGFDPAVSPAADYDMYLRVTRAHPVFGHRATIAEYRRHDANMTLDSARMLKATLTVYRAQWKHVKGNARYEQAYARGLHRWQEFYGEPLVNRIRSSVRKRTAWREAAGWMLVLLRYSPRLLVRHAGRKMYCLAFNSGNQAKEDLDAD